MDALMFGVMAAYIASKLRHPTYVLTLGAVPCLYYSYLILTHKYGDPNASALIKIFVWPITSVGFATILVGLHAAPVPRSVMRFVTPIALASYSIYLAHVPAQLAVARFLGFNSVPAFLASCVAIPGASFLAYVLVERPVMKWRARQSARSNSPSLADRRHDTKHGATRLRPVLAGE
jgi:peptidoglycan/LPS O-acetylase OafA/YrhL